MDAARKKALLAAYKNRKPEMGIIAVRCAETNETFLTPATDTAAYFNRIRFQLSAGNCPSQRLQQLWRQYGQDAFSFEVVKRLKYEDLKPTTRTNWPLYTKAVCRKIPRQGGFTDVGLYKNR